ncbi:MAG: hypothetical protein U0694_05365 [Anaerolineae bacterium]
MPIINQRDGLMFYIYPPDYVGDWIRDVITKPYVYELGSYMGCGCGFGNKDKWARRTLSRLRYYLEVALQAGSVELFYFWDVPMSFYLDKRHVTLEDIQPGCFKHDPEFFIIERVLPENKQSLA